MTKPDLNRTVETNIRADIEKLDGEIKDLSIEVKKVEDSNTAHRYDTEVGMGKIDSWRKRLKGIKDTFFTINKVTLSNGLGEDLYANTEAATNMLENLVTSTIEQISFEDVKFSKMMNQAEFADIVPPEIKSDTITVQEMGGDFEVVSLILVCSNCGEKSDKPTFLSKFENELSVDQMKVLCPDIQPISANSADNIISISR